MTRSDEEDLHNRSAARREDTDDEREDAVIDWFEELRAKALGSAPLPQSEIEEMQMAFKDKFEELEFVLF